MGARNDLVAGVCSGNARLVRSALRRGANPNARHRRRPVLLWAVQEGHINVARTLVRSGASLERRDDLGFTPLDQAVGEGDLELVKFLLEAGAKARGRTCNGTPLHTACAYRRLNIARVLLDHGADPSDVDADGLTPADLTKFRSNQTDKALRALLKRHQGLTRRCS